MDDATGDDPGVIVWSQPFYWGLLTVFDGQLGWDMPYEIGGSDIRASDTSLAVPVRHAADVEINETPLPDGPSSAEVEVRVLLAEQDSAGSVQFDGVLPSPSGQLLIGDAESERAVTVPAGMVRIRVRLEPAEHAEVVTLYIGRAQDD